MNSSLALAVILSFVGIIIFILISKNDLGVTSLKSDEDADSTLLGRMATGFPGSDISGTSVDIEKLKTDDDLNISK
tara:strand:- start:314 stop:541 length:228 start_codon:yes stop_codon:yes gene_type:complete